MGSQKKNEEPQKELLENLRSHLKNRSRGIPDNIVKTQKEILENPSINQSKKTEEIQNDLLEEFGMKFLKETCKEHIMQRIHEKSLTTVKQKSQK